MTDIYKILNSHKTLILDSSYQPVAIVPWYKSITLLLSGKGEPILFYDDIKINSVSSEYILPSVLKIDFKYKNHRRISFNKWTVFARDNFKCCYCSKKFAPELLSLDHVLPLARGGEKNWLNIVSACLKCNQDKACRTPEEAGLKMHWKPFEPKWSPWFIFRISNSELKECWRPFLSSKIKD